MVRKEEFEGVYPASFTPFKKDGSVNYGLIPKIVEYHLKSGVKGFYLCGNTGQGLVLTYEERINIFKTYKEVVSGRAKIIAHIGDVSTETSCKLTKEAEKIGVDAIASLPPIVYGKGFESTYEHYKKISSATSLPVFIYYYPTMVGGNIEVENFLSLFKIKNIIGMKFTSYNLFQMQNIIHATNSRILIMSGPDELALPSLVMGAKGNIGSTQNIFPLAFVKMFNNYKKTTENNSGPGDARRLFNEVLEIQYALNRIISVFLKYGKNSFKIAMRMAGFDCGKNRLPALNLEKGEAKKLEKELKSNGFYELFKI